MLWCYFGYWYHILHHKDSVFISTDGINDRKSAFEKFKKKKNAEFVGRMFLRCKVEGINTCSYLYSLAVFIKS